MKARVALFIGALASIGALALPSAQSGYKTPPKVVADIMNAEPAPAVSLSRDRKTMLLSYRRSMPTLAEVTAPWMGLAGSRINPRNNGPRVIGGTYRIIAKDVATGVERPLMEVAEGSIGASISPDSGKVAITHTTDNNIRLLVTDLATIAPRVVLAGGINGLAGGCSWIESSTGFFCRLIPDGRGAAPPKPQVPAGPNIQETSGKAAPGRTYQDLLASPYDEQLFDYYYTNQLAWVDLAGKKTNIGAAGVIQGASRPVMGVFAGPRGFNWHPTEPATLFWTEALDKGDPKNKVAHRDRVVTLKAPFTGEPAEVLKTEWRYGGMQFTEAGLAFVSESDRPTRMRRTWLFEPGFRGAPRKVWELRQEDRPIRDPPWGRCASPARPCRWATTSICRVRARQRPATGRFSIAST